MDPFRTIQDPPELPNDAVNGLELPEGFGRDYVDRTEEALERIEKALSENSSVLQELPKQTFVALLIRCGEHVSTPEGTTSLWWTSPSCKRAAQGILHLLVPQTPSGDVDIGPALSAVAAATKSDLPRWMQRPHLKHSVLWALFHSRHPHVGPVLNILQPFILQLIDDTALPNKLLGVKALRHCIEQCDPSVIRWHADLFMNALESVHYFREVPLCSEYVRCRVALLIVTEPDPQSSRLADALLAFLQDTDRPVYLEVKHIYLQGIDALIQRMGLYAIKYLKRLLGAVQESLQCGDDKIKLEALRCLVSIIRCCWPRIPGHSVEILKALSETFLSGSLKVQKAATFALQIFSKCCQNEFEEFVASCEELPPLRPLTEEARNCDGLTF